MKTTDLKNLGYTCRQTTRDGGGYEVCREDGQAVTRTMSRAVDAWAVAARQYAADHRA